MSDTTETVSLRDALLADIDSFLDDMREIDQFADAILDLLRAHRDETLEALGGREEMRRRDQRYGDEPIWVFGDCEPERGSMMARYRREWERKYGKDMRTGEPSRVFREASE